MEKVPDKSTIEIRRVNNGFVVTLPEQGKSDYEKAMDSVKGIIVDKLSKLGEEDDETHDPLLEKLKAQGAGPVPEPVKLPVDMWPSTQSVYVFGKFSEVLEFLEGEFDYLGG